MLDILVFAIYVLFLILSGDLVTTRIIPRGIQRFFTRKGFKAVPGDSRPVYNGLAAFIAKKEADLRVSHPHRFADEDLVDAVGDPADEFVDVRGPGPQGGYEIAFGDVVTRLNAAEWYCLKTKVLRKLGYTGRITDR